MLRRSGTFLSSVYGHDYPFQDFYDTSWLKAAVFDEATLFLVTDGDEGHFGGGERHAYGWQPQ